MEKPAAELPGSKNFYGLSAPLVQVGVGPLGNFFNRLGLTPNMMTVIGMIGNCIGAYFLARGEFHAAVCSC
ncbi:MAG: hypothetical protein U0X92_07810 [Anaerolineales bacterium]